MSKNDRIQSLFADKLNLSATENLESHPCYTGWFAYFNAGEFYTAHDVLEQLWLKTEGENYAFFKGMIQVAGAFVHLKKHYEQPDHPKHGRRLNPAARLFDLAASNLLSFGPRRLGLDVEQVCKLCEEQASEIRKSHYTKNPWTPALSPRIEQIQSTP